MRKHSIPRPRASRPLLVLAAAAALVLSLSSAAAAPAAPKAHPHKHSKRHKKAKARKASVPLSGIYDACASSEPKTQNPVPDCGDRLAVLRQGGFRVVLNYWTAAMSIDRNLTYADQAESLGMKLIWNLGTEVLSLDQKLDLVRATSSHPATWGYYIGDEVRPENVGEVAQLSRAVRSLTNRPLLYVSRPNPSMMRPFRKLADYIGPDPYPYGPFDPPVCRTSRWASKMAPRNSVMVLQAYSWSIDFPDFQPDWPNAGQMRQMRNQATRCGNPKLIMWFCFHCITDYNPTPDSYWRQLAWAANGVDLGPDYRLPRASTPGTPAT
jgi:hypothetical protein